MNPPLCLQIYCSMLKCGHTWLNRAHRTAVFSQQRIRLGALFTTTALMLSIYKSHMSVCLRFAPMCPLDVIPPPRRCQLRRRTGAAPVLLRQPVTLYGHQTVQFAAVTPIMRKERFKVQLCRFLDKEPETSQYLLPLAEDRGAERLPVYTLNE